jgi:hypothetical protein
MGKTRSPLNVAWNEAAAWAVNMDSGAAAAHDARGGYSMDGTVAEDADGPQPSGSSLPTCHRPRT